MVLASFTSASLALAPALKNHLWQSTLFLLLAALLALVLRSNRARERYWLWMAASLKFLLPFALLAGIGSHFARPHAAATAQPAVYFAVEDISEPFALQPAPATPATPADPIDWSSLLPALCAGVWLAGFVAVLAVWCVRWRRVARSMRASVPLTSGREIDKLRQIEQAASLRRPIELRLSVDSMEPGVFGILRPVLAWPAGISQRLDDAQLDAILAHEVSHVRRRDNLTAAVHMLVEAVFWFHPLVWWLGARLIEERERACDQEVLRLCSRPEVYAEGILKVCEFCLESPLPCVSGVTGSDLKRRIGSILAGRIALKLGPGRKLLLLAAALLTVAVPILLGQARAAQRMALAAIRSAPSPFSAMAHTLIAEEQTPSTGLIAEARLAQVTPIELAQTNAPAAPAVAPPPPAAPPAATPAAAPVSPAAAVSCKTSAECPGAQLCSLNPAFNHKSDADGKIVLGYACASASTAAPATPTSSAPDPDTPFGVVNPTIPHINFDVVLFKPCKPNEVGSTVVDMPMDSDYIAYHCQPVFRIIYFAYGRSTGYSFKLSGYPAWVDSDPYEFEAKVAPEDIAKWQQISLNERRYIIRGLLVDELKLKMHLDTALVPIYVLTVAKNGPKLKKYTPGEQQKLPDGRMLNGRDIGEIGWIAYYQDTTMVNLVSSLSYHLDRQVVNQTGLEGGYDFSLPLPYGTGNYAGADLPDDTPSTIEGLAKLGLKLTASKGAVGGLIVDHIERPPDN